MEGKTQETKVKYYNLDAIISIGYRVNSSQATAFRIWATERLKEYIIKGFTMDDERLKNPNNIFGKDYFEEQLARIRDIRSSERRFYQKITDIYTQCSADYNVETQSTKDFFSPLQILARSPLSPLSDMQGWQSSTAVPTTNSAYSQVFHCSFLHKFEHEQY